MSCLRHRCSLQPRGRAPGLRAQSARHPQPVGSVLRELAEHVAARRDGRDRQSRQRQSAPQAARAQAVEQGNRIRGETAGV
jgi:hypothetical protein